MCRYDLVWKKTSAEHNEEEYLLLLKRLIIKLLKNTIPDRYSLSRVGVGLD